MHSLAPRCAAMRTWLTKPLGQALLEQEAQVLNQLMPDIPGDCLVTLGEPDFGQCVSNTHFVEKYLLNVQPVPALEFVSVRSRQDKLPIESESVSVVYLAHCLELSNNPHEVLREAARILQPDGYVVITGFNSISPWGLWKAFAWIARNAPWCAKFMSAHKLSDWLALLGFEVSLKRKYMGRFPIPNQKIQAKFIAVEKYIHHLDWLPLAGCYVLVASKKVMPLTPLKPRWRFKQSVLAEGLAKPSARV